MRGFNLTVALAIALSLLPLGAITVAGESQVDQFAVIERRVEMPNASSDVPISALSFTHLDAAEGLTFNAIARNALKGEDTVDETLVSE